MVCDFDTNFHKLENKLNHVQTYLHTNTHFLENNFVRAWFINITLITWHIKLSFCTHVSKGLETKSSLYTRNEGYIEPASNFD